MADRAVTPSTGSDPALAHFREAMERGEKRETAWNDRLRTYIDVFPELASELQGSLRGELPAGNGYRGGNPRYRC
jgi:transketolase